jgi:hypothetical protein
LKVVDEGEDQNVEVCMDGDCGVEGKESDDAVTELTYDQCKLKSFHHINTVDPTDDNQAILTLYPWE